MTRKRTKGEKHRKERKYHHQTSEEARSKSTDARLVESEEMSPVPEVFFRGEDEEEKVVEEEESWTGCPPRAWRDVNVDDAPDKISTFREISRRLHKQDDINQEQCVRREIDKFSDKKEGSWLFCGGRDAVHIENERQK